MKFSDSKINVFYILSKESFFYISGNGTLYFVSPGLTYRKKFLLKTFLYFREIEPFGSNIKKFLIFQETETP